jgi:hypothetical protein
MEKKNRESYYYGKVGVADYVTALKQNKLWGKNKFEK